MGSMRQRLLLVAGWAAAAVVASLVSTGAVAVAGGQVIDRPLRPLSASEVAALTEDCGSTDRAPCLRQLDRSIAPQDTVEAASQLNSSPDGDEDGVSRTTVTEPPSEDALDPGADLDESLLPPDDKPSSAAIPEPRAEVVDLVGGRVSVSGAAGGVRIIWLIPRHGYALVPASTRNPEQDQVTVVLSNGSHQSTLAASWDPVEGLVIETTEGGVTHSEG
jgi:hypothetical protein